MAYYKTDSRKITYREYWRLTRNANVLIPWFNKLFGIPMRLADGIVGPGPIAEMTIAAEEIPENGRAELCRIAEAIVAEGLGLLRFATQKESLLPRIRVYIADLADPSGRCWGRVFVSMRGAPLRVVKSSFVAFSRMNDGTFRITSNMRQEFDGVPFAAVNRMEGKTPVAVLHAHFLSLERPEISAKLARFTSQEELESWIDEYESRCFEHALDRGRYVEMTLQEVEKARAIKATMEGASGAAPPPLPEADPVVDALQQELQAKPKSWNNLGILAISVAAFYAVGRTRWSSPGLIGVIIAVLFIHELGHFAAMKLFRYKNLQMFFIPFFGAAVHGKKLERAAWKKAVVSLMGPGPGIVLGFILAFAALIYPNEWLEKFALMLCILNGFNLLPFLPLDGGWLMQALFFSRHPVAETAFKAVAGAGLILVGLDTHSVILEVLGVFGLISIPVSYKLARLAHEIQRAPAELPPDDGSIAPRLVQQISARVRELPGATDLKSIIDLTRQTYEKVIQQPPRWWATALLFVSYAGLCGMALLGWGVVLNAKQGRLVSSDSPDFVFKLAAQIDTDATNTVMHGVVLHPTNAPVPGLQFTMVLPPPTTNFFAMTRGEFRELNRRAADAFLPDLRQTFVVPVWSILPTTRTNVVPFTAAILGTNLVHAHGTNMIAGDFTSDAPGDWIVAKIFFDEYEFYLALNPVESIGMISRKEPENGPEILAEFGKLFDGQGARKRAKRGLR